MAEQLDLSVDLGRGLRLRSPVMVASGTFGYGFDAPLVDRTALGAIVTKGTTPRAREGNAPTRIAETPSGMLNAIGLQNPGVDHVARIYAPMWAAWDVPVIANVGGGVSGRTIKPLALHAVWQLSAALGIPVVGIGGIMTAADALEFLLAGAAAVQLGAVNYVRPQAAREVRDGIASYLDEHDLDDL